jgi:hypothetical protein
MKSESKEDELLGATRAMSAMTGVELPEPWLEKTIPIVRLVLHYSRDLRKLDLGDIEPATFFRVR